MWEFFILMSLPLAILVYGVIPAIRDHNAHKEDRAKERRKKAEHIERYTAYYMRKGMDRKAARKEAERSWYRW